MVRSELQLFAVDSEAVIGQCELTMDRWEICRRSAIDHSKVTPLGVLCAAVLCVVGCASDVGTASIPSLSADESLLPVTTHTSSDTYVAIAVTSVEQIGSVPYDIRPLPNGVVPTLSVDDAMARVVDGNFGFFFTTQRDREGASIKVGLITDHSNAGAPTDDDPTFPGYVIFGGHATCTWSGPVPVPPATVGDRQGPCHAEIIINGDTGEVPTESQISD